MKIVLATRNKNKIRELEELLATHLKKIEVLSLDDIGFVGEIEETGNSFEQNAMIKARAAADFSGMISVADDSGLTVNALGGAPGIYSARYSGVEGPDRDRANNEKLLRELQGVSSREAAFVCCIACAFPDSMPARDFAVYGYTVGEILCVPRGDNGFGYDPLFWYDELGKTFAEMTPQEKNSLSHRAKAAVKLAERFANMIIIEG
ncbi:MAG: RdgB/HAM1 family non-canonical purine NTP pyrophosphatase [Eubacteriales bacterium]|nr:RdgB/HAM1 family non-canonical purine NTP pyrophosphatase [Eubacteriales bacterium]